MREKVKIGLAALIAFCLGAAALPAQDESSAARPAQKEQSQAAAAQDADAVEKAPQAGEERDKEAGESTARLSAGKGPAGAQQIAGQRTHPVNIPGFIDRDRDGRNDLFRDADGDGINDVTGREYQHNFRFVDSDGDKINDLFVDEDGDGVNDLDIRFIDEDGDGICDNVLDFNKDYINDITGLRFNRKSLRGYKFGFIKEERNLMLQRFIDEDADGLPDLRRPGMGPHGPGPRDVFIDRDGDGIDDRREHMQRLGKGPMGGKK